MTARDRYLQPDIETMPRADLVALQEERLLEMISWAYRRSPLTRLTWERAGVKPRDIKSLGDFRARAPFINKDAIREFRDRYTNAGDAATSMECRERTGCHVPEDRLLAEHVDPFGPGRGCSGPAG